VGAEPILSIVVVGAVLCTGVLSVIHTDWVVRVSNASVVTQVGLVLISWLLLATMPQRRNWSGALGATCSDFDTPLGIALIVVAFASLAIGSVALLSSIVSVVRRAARWGRLGAGFGTAALCLAIWVPFIGQALCGSN
jgi:hypothetical protein